LLVQLQDRNADTIKFVLGSIAETLHVLELVITDGYPGYKNMIPEIFEGIVHLFCHVHAYRVFLREIDPINAAARKACVRWRNAVQAQKDLEHEVRLKKRCLSRDETRLDKVIVARDAFYVQHGIKKSSKITTWAAERKWFNEQTNIDRTKVRSRKQTISNKRKKLATMITEVEALKSTYWEKKQKSLQSARLVSGFKRMLDTPWERFEAERVRFAFVLAKSSLDIARKISRFMQLNPHVCATSKQEFEAICPPWLANTNTIEGFFGGCRPILDKAKHFGRSAQSTALLDIFRLKNNLSSPNTGPHRHESPLQRAGVTSRYNDYLDALFPLNQSTYSMRNEASSAPDRNPSLVIFNNQATIVPGLEVMTTIAKNG
jgi:hypothetical protein